MDEKQLNMLKEFCIIDENSTRQMVGDKALITFVRNGIIYNEMVDAEMYDDFEMCKEV